MTLDLCLPLLCFAKIRQSKIKNPSKSELRTQYSESISSNVSPVYSAFAETSLFRLCTGLFRKSKPIECLVCKYNH